MMTLAFLPARPEEAGIVSELRRRAWETTYRGIFPDEMMDGFDFAWHTERDLQRIESDRFSVYFLVAGDEKIGYLILQKGEPFHLQSLYLLQEHRGRGYGTQVFAFVRQYCRERGIRQFHLDCHPDNVGAMNFYAKMGGTIISRDLGHERNEENGVTFAFDV